MEKREKNRKGEDKFSEKREQKITINQYKWENDKKKMAEKNTHRKFRQVNGLISNGP